MLFQTYVCFGLKEDTQKSFKTKATWMSDVLVGHLPKASCEIIHSEGTRSRLVLQFIRCTGDPRGVTAQGHVADVRSLTTDTPMGWGWGVSSVQGLCCEGCRNDLNHPSPVRSPRDKRMGNRGGNSIEKKQDPLLHVRGSHISEGGGTILVPLPACVKSLLTWEQ